MSEDGWTAQDKVLAIVPKFSGFLSLCGSTYIVQHVLRSRERRNFVYHRILCAMSCSDVLGSSMYVLSTWPIPRGYAVYAVGNQASCNFSGTLDQFASLTTPLFSGSLSIYYLLVIRYGWREEQVQKYQAWLFLIPFGLGASTSIAGLAMELYNPADWVCWIAPFPPGCEDDSPTNPCTRGINADLYRMVFSYAIVWVVFGVLAITMGMIYRKVRATELKTAKYKASSFLGSNVQPPSRQPSDPDMLETKPKSEHEEPKQDQNQNQEQEQQSTPPEQVHEPCSEEAPVAPASEPLERQDSAVYSNDSVDTLNSTRPNKRCRQSQRASSTLTRTVMNQSIMYMGAFYLTFIFGTIARVLQIWNITFYPIFVCMTLFFPLQGFWQYLIYTRPARQKQRQKRLDELERRKRSDAFSCESSSAYTRNPLLAINIFSTSWSARRAALSSIPNASDQMPADVGASPPPEPSSSSSVVERAEEEEEAVDVSNFDNAERELEYISNYVG